MIARTASGVIVTGVTLSVLYTALISMADAITKMFAVNYAAPQLFALSGGLVALLSVLANRDKEGARGMHTTCPRAMVLRAGATVAGTVAFFYAFKLLPFAEVFLFIALIPILSALLSGPVLGEAVRPQAFGAVVLGAIGVMFLFPAGLHSIGAGHLVALAAVMLGTVSMMASRYIGMRDDNLLAQVFYPNLALMVVMACALPFVFRAMAPVDLLWVATYAVFLFGARWVLVAALRMLPAYVVTALMNLQFLWMVGLGLVIFGEAPGTGVFIGAGIVIVAGLWLIWDQVRPVSAKVVPAE